MESELGGVSGRLVAGAQLRGGPPRFATGADDEPECPGIDTVVSTSSAGKQLAAACVGMLILDGMLDLDEPVRRWLPELPAWADPIRVRHLVDHTSGLPEEAVFQLGRSGAVRTWTNESVLGLLTGLPGPRHEAGTVHSYSSLGYICLATAAERASGRSLPELAQRRIFTPLGMTATRFWTGPQLHPPSVTMHPPWYPGLPPAQTVGDGGVWSSVRDLLRGHTPWPPVGSAASSASCCTDRGGSTTALPCRTRGGTSSCRALRGRTPTVDRGQAATSTSSTSRTPAPRPRWWRSRTTRGQWRRSGDGSSGSAEVRGADGRGASPCPEGQRFTAATPPSPDAQGAVESPHSEKRDRP